MFARTQENKDKKNQGSNIKKEETTLPNEGD